MNARKEFGMAAKERKEHIENSIHKLAPSRRSYRADQLASTGGARRSDFLLRSLRSFAAKSTAERMKQGPL